jgi:glutamyl-tRNA reductase
MALGESEVLGQVRRALALAREAGATRSVLHRLFEWAVAAGKRVRAETEIGMHPLSIPAIGFELASKVFGELPERTVLVLGAGETAALFARHATEAGVSDLRIANRTPERARDLAARVGGRAVAWETLGEQIAGADVVVGTTASPAPVVRRSDVEAAMRQRRGRPIFFLDLAVPRDIEEEAADVYNVFRHGVNDLEEVALENRRRRAREIPEAEAILEEELGKFLAWFGNLSIVPTVTDLRRRFEVARDAELAPRSRRGPRKAPCLRRGAFGAPPARAAPQAQGGGRSGPEARSRRRDSPSLRPGWPRREVGDGLKLRLGARGARSRSSRRTSLPGRSKGKPRSRS